MQEWIKFYPEGFEMFLVRGKLVATQPLYSIALKEDRHEVKHFYCGQCGEVWGMRLSPQASLPLHFYKQSKCKACGGDEDMLTPFEWNHFDTILGANVLAYLILSTELKAQPEIEEISNG